MASFYILLAIFLWSSLGVVVRLSGIAVHMLIFYSMVVSIAVQGMLLCQKKYRREFPDIKKIRYPVILGFCSLLNTFMYFYAFQNTTIANAVLTHYTAPVIVALISPLFVKETITKRLIMVIVIASVGLWIMLDGFTFDEGHTAGIIAGLISGLAYALIIIFLRLHSHKFHPLVLSFFTNIVVATLLLPFIREIPITALWSFLFMGIVHSTIAPILYYKGIQKVPANKTAVFGYLEPVCAILLGLLFLQEYLRTNTIIGGILILLSGYLTIRSNDH